MHGLVRTNQSLPDWRALAAGLELRAAGFVGGRRRSPIPQEVVREKIGPRDGRVLGRVQIASEKAVCEAVADCKDSFADGRWARRSTSERRSALNKLADLVEKNSQELALLESLDTGKPIQDVVGVDVPLAATLLRYAAEAADKIHGKVFAVDHNSLSYQLLRPVGVVAAIVGWNFPLVLASSKAGPALAVGNSVILKPSEQTSFSTGRFAELALEAGIPPGVLNVVNGDAATGEVLAKHGDVALLSFTGSTSTGKRLLIASGQSNMKRLLLECGSKAPHIVFQDCPDLDAVADAVVSRAYFNQGQVCTASSRLLVHQSIKAELLERVVKRVATLVPGDPLDPETKYGAVVSAQHKMRILAYELRAEADGIRIAYKSAYPAPFENGFYVPSTVFDDVPRTHPIAREEIFGPVLAVLSFADENEAIQIANETAYGLSAVVWTRDPGRAHRMAYEVRVGWIVINTTECPGVGPPEGVLSVGGHNQSGLGVEGGLEGLIQYTSQTAVQQFV